jgi:hypothetical protein
MADDAYGMLIPMLRDKVTTVQQTAALALGRIAGASKELSTAFVETDGLRLLCDSMAEAHPAYLKAGAFVIRSVAKHDEQLCQACIDAGSIHILVSRSSQPKAAKVA